MVRDQTRVMLDKLANYDLDKLLQNL